MRNLISVATVLLALVAGRAALSLTSALNAEGALAIFIPQVIILLLSVAGLVYWQRQQKFGTHLLLGAWVVAVSAGMASTVNGAFISLQVLVGVPVIVMLVLSFGKWHANGSRT